MSSGDDESLTISTLVDVERARRLVRAYALKAGLRAFEVEELVLAASEIAGNLVKHGAFRGVLTCRLQDSGDDAVVEVEVRDMGPGIADVPRAMKDDYSTLHSLGSGLPAARRHVDFFRIESSPAGTTIRLGKRLRSH